MIMLLSYSSAAVSKKLATPKRPALKCYNREEEIESKGMTYERGSAVLGRNQS
jgi:hypothetical protein